MTDKAVPGKMVAVEAELRARGMAEIRDGPRRGGSDRDTRSGREGGAKTWCGVEAMLLDLTMRNRPCTDQKAAILSIWLLFCPVNVRAQVAKFPDIDGKGFDGYGRWFAELN